MDEPSRSISAPSSSRASTRTTSRCLLPSAAPPSGAACALRSLPAATSAVMITGAFGLCLGQSAKKGSRAHPDCVLGRPNLVRLHLGRPPLDNSIGQPACLRRLTASSLWCRCGRLQEGLACAGTRRSTSGDGAADGCGQSISILQCPRTTPRAPLSPRLNLRGTPHRSSTNGSPSLPANLPRYANIARGCDVNFSWKLDDL